MKHFITALLLVIGANSSYTQTALIFDHTSASLFQSIPAEFVSKAAKLRLMYRHASVGTTVDGGLNCLQGTKNRCTEYPQYQYDRRNWVFQIRPNSGWFGKINDFTTEVRRQIDSFDVFSFKYCYLDGLDQVAEPCGGYPSKPDKVNLAWQTLRDSMLALESAFPAKKFIWWTIPLTQVGQHCTDELNARIRSYCRDNGKILFDIADIESYDTVGNRVLTTDGLELAFKPYCGEQKPDAEACHPNDFGSTFISKAFWVMMAQVSGWQPDVQSVGSSTRHRFSISPNPAGDYIDVSFDDQMKQKSIDAQSVEIISASGARITYPLAILSTESGLRVYISELPAGVYVITFAQERGKFIKQ